MIVSDNGIGMPEEIDLNNSNSLGIELIHSLVDQIDGSIEIGSENGTKYLISFPIT